MNGKEKTSMCLLLQFALQKLDFYISKCLSKATQPKYIFILHMTIFFWWRISAITNLFFLREKTHENFNQNYMAFSVYVE